MTDQVSDQVKRLLQAIGESEQTSAGLIQQLQLSHAPTFRKNYLTPRARRQLDRTHPAELTKKPHPSLSINPEG